MTEPTGNSKYRPPLKPLEKFTEARMESGGIPAKSPLFFAHTQTVQACESPISLGWQETCVLTPWRWGGRWGACQLQSTLRVSQPCLRQREDSGEGETAAVQVQISAGFPLLPTKFWLLIGECWYCLTGRCGSLEPGGMKVVGGKVRLSC